MSTRKILENISKRRKKTQKECHCCQEQKCISTTHSNDPDSQYESDHECRICRKYTGDSCKFGLIDDDRYFMEDGEKLSFNKYICKNCIPKYIMTINDNKPKGFSVHKDNNTGIIVCTQTYMALDMKGVQWYISQLLSKINSLEVELMYRPGGKGAKEAQSHFEGLIKKNDSN